MTTHYMDTFFTLPSWFAQACMLLYEQDLSYRLSNVIDYNRPCNDEKLFCSDALCVPAPDASSDSHYVSVSGSGCIGFNPSQQQTVATVEHLPACPCWIACRSLFG